MKDFLFKQGNIFLVVLIIFFISIQPLANWVFSLNIDWAMVVEVLFALQIVAIMIALIICRIEEKQEGAE